MTLSWVPSLVVGALLGALNFFLIVKIVRRIIPRLGRDLLPSGQGPWGIVLLVTLKLALVAGIIILIVQKGYVRPLALLAGFTLALGGIILCMTLRGSDSSRTE